MNVQSFNLCDDAIVNGMVWLCLLFIMEFFSLECVLFLLIKL